MPTGTEPCALCGAAIPEGGTCKNATCRAAWERYHGPKPKPEPSPRERDDER